MYFSRNKKQIPLKLDDTDSTCFKDFELFSNVEVPSSLQGNPKQINIPDLSLQRIRLEDLHPHFKDKYIFHIGELHTVVCALRAIGSLIESSNIDDAWICADVYGPKTTPQITTGKHTKRGVTAQTTTLIALSKLNLSHFFESHPSLLDKISPAIHAFSNELANGTENINLHVYVIDLLDDYNILCTIGEREKILSPILASLFY